LGENLEFTSILYLSLLNSLQILAYVPSLVILLSVILFINFLRNKNELIIIKEYFSSNKIILTVIPLAVLFTIIELNKGVLSSKLENFKIEHLKSNSYLDTKVLINKNNHYKSYIILKKIDTYSNTVEEFQKYEISHDRIIGGEYSNKLRINANKILTNGFIRFENNEITEFKNEDRIIFILNDLSHENLIVTEIIDDKSFNFDQLNIDKIIYFIFFYLCIFLILFNRKIIDRKQSLIYPVLISLALLIYSLFINYIDLKFFIFEMQILTLILIILTFFKFYKYE
tara:strand:- start:227 stop:1081 length:855 start_codon:yes stop_codon:yes gene_type:complete